MECRRLNGIIHLEALKEPSKVETSSFYYDLMELSESWSLGLDSEEFARKLDEEDPLKDFRKRFHYPKKRQLEGIDTTSLADENEECIYMCGQSLGLQLKSVESKVRDVLKDWAERGVECHFTGHLPAAFCDTPLKEKMAALVGALPNEVAIMNGLTVNIHMVLGSFYNPTPERYKILLVSGGFHSDLYAVQSHITLRGYASNESILFLEPKPGDYLVNPAEVRRIIAAEGEKISIIFLEGVHFYTGQLFDMKDITRLGHEKGCVVGFDLAHAVGNVELQLHDWNVDFAVWCTYKYLNSGPGCMGVLYSHDNHTHGANAILPTMRGWWGLNDKRKFAFDKEFTPADGADRFKLSNPSPVLSIMILANLEVFIEAGLQKLRKKQRLITGYLDYLLRKMFPQNMDPSEPQIKIITPSNPRQRGSQISLFSTVPISTFETVFKEKGIVCDVRKPSVIRVTPVPLYNTYSEVYQFVHTLKEIWDTMPYENNYEGEK